MNTERKIWETLTSKYIRKVERVLARVDHPRKKEVLQDLRDHLEQRFADLKPDQRTPDQLEAVIKEMGPPEEYAELLSPATGAAPRKWYRRRITYLILLAVVVLVAARYLFFPDNQTIGLYIRELFGTNYSAPPFFSLKNFKRIQPGMTPDEVRDLIGFPLRRYSVVGLEDETRWEYTAVAVDTARFYTKCVVIFSRKSGSVLRKRNERVRLGRPEPMLKPRWVNELRKEIGDLHLTRPEGGERILKHTDKIVYLILLDTGENRSDINYSINAGTRWAEENLGELPADRIKALRLYIGRTPQEYAEILNEINSSIFDAYVTTTPGIALPQGERRALVYKEGILYTFPPIYGGAHADAWRGDQRWLIQRLLR
jgi:hypothetical protein